MKEFAKTKSGHDKDQIFLIAREDENYVYLVDGKNKLMNHPKKKNRKHIQIIKNLPEDVEQLLNDTSIQEDVRIKSAIKAYRTIIGKDKN